MSARTDEVTALSGPPGVGKTSSVRDWLRGALASGAIRFALVMSPSSAELVEGLSQAQRRAVLEVPGFNRRPLAAYLAMIRRRWPREADRPSNAIVIDDSASQLNVRDRVFLEALTRHRHYSASVVIATQNSSSLMSPTVRDCISTAVAFKLRSAAEIESFWRNFGRSSWDTLDEFQRAVAALSPHGQIRISLRRIGSDGRPLVEISGEVSAAPPQVSPAVHTQRSKLSRILG